MDIRRFSPLIVLLAFVASFAVAFAQEASVIVFWHQNGLSEREATTIKNKLSKLGIDVVVTQHGDPRAPDAIYIKPDADAAAVRIILSTLEYAPSYIFPVDYPNDEVGIDSEFSVSVGLRSTHRYYEDEPAEVPYKVSWSALSSLIEPGITQAEFERRLKKIAPSRAGSN
jgi:hypothetical protein